MKRPISWDLLRTFSAVMHEGSLSAAARVLGITQPSVSRHVDELEAALGAKLFLRTQRGLSPTDRALVLRPYADEMSGTSAALLRAASASPDVVEGSVRVTASEVVAVEHLPTILAGLRHANPLLSIELSSSNALDDLLARRADIAVRMVDPSQQTLLARKVGAVTLGLYAHRDYLARRGIPNSLEDLGRHDIIGPETISPFVRLVLAQLRTVDPLAFALRCDSDLVQLATIRAGGGIGVTQVEIAQRDPGLVRVLASAFSHDLPLWIAMHEDLRTSAKCRAVFDALVAGLGSKHSNVALPTKAR